MMALFRRVLVGNESLKTGEKLLFRSIYNTTYNKKGKIYVK